MNCANPLGELMGWARRLAPGRWTLATTVSAAPFPANPR